MPPMLIGSVYSVGKLFLPLPLRLLIFMTFGYGDADGWLAQGEALRFTDPTQGVPRQNARLARAPAQPQNRGR